MKKIIFAIFWILSIFISVIWSYENPEKIEILKNSFKKNKNPQIKNVDTKKLEFTANSFEVNLEKIINFKEKTAFIIYPKKEIKFNKEKLKIFSQNGYII